MIGNKVLLDTNIISALLKGDDSVADNIDRSEQAFIPAIVLGELHYGAQYSTRIAKNMESIGKLAARYEIIKVDASTAIIYGKIKAVLRKKGRPIPENDIWIAAITQQHQLTLITRDQHFQEIESIKIESW